MLGIATIFPKPAPAPGAVESLAALGDVHRPHPPGTATRSNVGFGM